MEEDKEFWICSRLTLNSVCSPGGSRIYGPSAPASGTAGVTRHHACLVYEVTEAGPRSSWVISKHSAFGHDFFRFFFFCPPHLSLFLSSPPPSLSGSPITCMLACSLLPRAVLKLCSFYSVVYSSLLFGLDSLCCFVFSFADRVLY